MSDLFYCILRTFLYQITYFACGDSKVLTGSIYCYQIPNISKYALRSINTVISCTWGSHPRPASASCDTGFTTPPQSSPLCLLSCAEFSWRDPPQIHFHQNRCMVVWSVQYILAALWPEHRHFMSFEKCSHCGRTSLPVGARAPYFAVWRHPSWPGHGKWWGAEWRDATSRHHVPLSAPRPDHGGLPKYDVSEPRGIILIRIHFNKFRVHIARKLFPTRLRTVEWTSKILSQVLYWSNCDSLNSVRHWVQN